MDGKPNRMHVETSGRNGTCMLAIMGESAILGGAANARIRVAAPDEVEARPGGPEVPEV